MAVAIPVMVLTILTFSLKVIKDQDMVVLTTLICLVTMVEAITIPNLEAMEASAQMEDVW